MSLKDRGRVVGKRVERGSVLAVMAIGMLSTLLIAGMCIDISHLYMAKIELQDAADAAALGAASQLNSTSGGIRLAITQATKQLNKYDVKQDVSIPSSAVTFSVNLNGPYLNQSAAEAQSAKIRFVKVTIPPKPIGISLASTVLGDTQNIGATATAGMSVSLTMNKFYSALIFIEDEGASGCGVSGGGGLELGESYTLSPKIWSSNAADSYRVLAGTGGDLILTGSIHAYGYADGTYTAALLSQADDCRIARIGVNTRFGDYSWHSGSNATDEPPDTIIDQTISYDTYRQRQGDGVVERSDGLQNRRILTLPIAKNDDYNTVTRNIKANRIGAFFLKKKMDATCNLEVEYIGSHLTVPVGEYQPGSIQLNELSIPVIYR
ncbi:MAG TPA: pilus assembly protein TadG-related protein [Blastocatellia bacterium]|nr:pilus assembly protein TadG-related protein [Blastocatellia bacterium]